LAERTKPVARRRADIQHEIATPLQRLISEQRRAAGLSYGDVERRSRDADGVPRVTRPSVERLEKVPVRSALRPRTVLGLASGLGVPVAAVRDAITRSLGLYTGSGATDPAMDELLSRVDELPPGARTLWIRLATMIARELGATDAVSAPHRDIAQGTSEPIPAERSDIDSDKERAQALFDVLRERPEIMQQLRALSDSPEASD
jgi:hypothetical protein